MQLHVDDKCLAVGQHFWRKCKYALSHTCTERMTGALGHNPTRGPGRLFWSSFEPWLLVHQCYLMTACIFTFSGITLLMRTAHCRVPTGLEALKSSLLLWAWPLLLSPQG